MATPTVKSTYVMDLETAETLDRLARDWQVTKSEALRRAIRAAAAGDPPDRVKLFRSLQQAAGVTRGKADRWTASVRADRAGTPRRKTIIAAFASVFVIVAAAAFSQGQSSRTSTPADVQTAVLARLADIQRAAEALDADKVFSFVLENDAGALAQNGRLYLTRTEALESTKQGFRGLRGVSYRFDGQHITMLSPTVALATGEGSSSATLDDGRTLSARFAQSVVFVLTNGEWKVLHAHRSFPPAT